MKVPGVETCFEGSNELALCIFHVENGGDNPRVLAFVYAVSSTCSLFSQMRVAFSLMDYTLLELGMTKTP